VIIDTRLLADDNHGWDWKPYQLLVGQTEGKGSPVGPWARWQGGFKMSQKNLNFYVNSVCFVQDKDSSDLAWIKYWKLGLWKKILTSSAPINLPRRTSVSGVGQLEFYVEQMDVNKKKS